jgi:TetR/AcrR family transcriptional regulator
MENQINTEQKILDAAGRVFLKSGINGARMQEIADEAGINKALLHYYFRSKEKLFEAVFQLQFRRSMEPVIRILFSPDRDFTVENRIRTLVRTYYDILIDDPLLPLFIMHELSQNPSRLVSVVMESQENSGDLRLFERQIDDGIAQGRYHPVDPRHFIVSMLGMCVYPFAAKPLIQKWLQKDDAGYREFLLQRTDEVISSLFRILIKTEKDLP